jgi:hypothetical protein
VTKLGRRKMSFIDVSLAVNIFPPHSNVYFLLTYNQYEKHIPDKKKIDFIYFSLHHDTFTAGKLLSKQSIIYNNIAS